MNRPPPGRLRLPKSPTVVEDVLPGGMRAIGVRQRGIPLVEIQLVFAVGAETVAKGAGPSVLAESILAGTERHDRSELAEAVERLGGRVGAGRGEDHFSVNASVLADNLRPLLEIMAELLLSASYPVDEVRADRERLANETLMALRQPEVIADEALRRRLYAGHPYAAGLPRPSTLRRVGRQSLLRLHSSLLDPSAACLVMVGDVEPRRALAMAADLLAPWLETSSTSITDLPALPALRLGPIELIAREGSVQSNIRLARRAPARSAPDWPAASLANLVFGGLFASRLVENLRERHGYTYFPRSAIRHGRAGSTLVVEADVGREATAAALLETRYELGRIAVDGVTPEELEAARRYSVGSFAFLTATQSGLAETLATLALNGIGPGYLTSHPAAVAKTPKAAVDEAARRYLAPAGLVTVVVGDADAIAGPLSAVDSVAVKGT